MSSYKHYDCRYFQNLAYEKFIEDMLTFTHIYFTHILHYKQKCTYFSCQHVLMIQYKRVPQICLAWVVNADREFSYSFVSVKYIVANLNVKHIALNSIGEKLSSKSIERDPLMLLRTFYSHSWNTLFKIPPEFCCKQTLKCHIHLINCLIA